MVCYLTFPLYALISLAADPSDPFPRPCGVRKPCSRFCRVIPGPRAILRELQLPPSQFCQSPRATFVKPKIGRPSA